MTTQTIELEAETLEEVRNKIDGQIPEGFQLFSERVISSGNPRSIKEIANTAKDAFEKALIQVPSDGKVIEKIEIAAPAKNFIIVEAFDEQSAISHAEQQAMRQTVRHLENTIIVKGIKLVSLGTKGFLGLGRKPNKYEAEIFWQAAVEIIYKQNVRVSFELLDTKTFEEKKRTEEWQAQQDALE